MIDYEREVLCEKQQGLKALDFSLNSFIQHGFAIVKKDQRGYELKGPGMISSRQSPLLGISRLICFLQGNQLKLQAEFGAVRKLKKIMILFLCALALFLVLFFALLFNDRPTFNPWLPLAPFLPWPFLIPFMFTIFFNRTRKALDVLIDNAVTMTAPEGRFV